MAGKPLCQLTADDIQAFADIQTFLAPGTRGRAMAAVRSFLSFARRMGNLSSDIAETVRLAPLRRRVGCHLLPANVVNYILVREPAALNRLLLRLAYIGQRSVEEICTLRWHDLQFDVAAGFIVVRDGTRAVRQIPCPAADWNELAAVRAAGKDAPVFQSAIDCQLLSRLEAERIVAAAARRTGLPACSVAGVRLLALSGSLRANRCLGTYLPLRSRV